MRFALMTVALAAISTAKLAAMSLSEIRSEARFLTDRMGHELGLSNRQYEDVYEINFDFLYQVNEVIDDVVYGYDDAIDYYYYLLDVRNEDLMYVLRSNQYHKFMKRDYFFRPIYMAGRTWGMRIWDRYDDRNYFYFGTPACYLTYNGAHYRIHFNLSYYADRYSHKLFDGAFRLWGAGYDHHKHDGWKRSGDRKYASVGSRPWSNAKNYEKSRKNLREGYVNIPSRDADKRKVKVDSEENRRTAMASDTPMHKRTEDAKRKADNRSGSIAPHRDKSSDKASNKDASSQKGKASSKPSDKGGATAKGKASDNASAKDKPSSTIRSSSSSANRNTGAAGKSASVSSSRSSSSSSVKSNTSGSSSSRSSSR